MKALNLRLPDEIHQQVRREAFDREISINNWILDAIEQKLRGSAKMTIAHQVAELLNNDGQNYAGFDQVIEKHNGTAIRGGTGQEHLTRYAFNDGSAIVDADGGGWDVEGSTPFSWESEE